MTPTTKPVTRESNERLDRRNIIVIVGPGNILAFRLKGTRRTYETTIGACASLAIKQWANAERARRLALRKAKREGRS
jgi:hypothetical protein